LHVYNDNVKGKTIWALEHKLLPFLKRIREKVGGQLGAGRLKVLINVKEKVLGFFVRFARVVSLPLRFISSVDKWTLRRGMDSKISFPFIERREHSSFQILQYHRIDGHKDQIFSGVPVRVFERQMEGLSRYYNVYPLEELVERAFRKDIPPRAVAITFDDGYRDSYDNAFPILKRFGFPTTIFLTTGAIESQIPLWHDRVFYAFGETHAPAANIGGKQYPLGTFEERDKAVFAFRRYLRDYEYGRWNSLIEQLCADLGVALVNCHRNAQKLSWSQVEEMSKYRITFGAHTVTHPILTNLALPEAMDEVLASKKTIEEKLNAPARLFAYPNGNRGDFNEPIKHALKEAGFLCAVTILWGSNDFQTDPFELRRVGMWDRGPLISAMKLGWQKFLS
jgi:peptidoglycan/xylan/chitin deacetylase (PgdA/CDA1 family)